jgi:ribosomal protein S18 acetylase RimI-like enzyme
VPYRSAEPLNREHVFDDFDCGSPALNEWLRKHALASQASDSARVYVSTELDSQVVAGYYALAAAQVEPQNATSRLGKGQPKHRPIPVVLLARLAVDLEHQRAGLGRSLLRDALARTLAAGERIGVRALLVHAKDDDAQEWYRQFGFESSPTDPLHMVLLMKDIRAVID